MKLAENLTGTSLWTGVRLKDILAEASMKPGAKEVYITGGGWLLRKRYHARRHG